MHCPTACAVSVLVSARTSWRWPFSKPELISDRRFSISNDHWERKARKVVICRWSWTSETPISPPHAADAHCRRMLEWQKWWKRGKEVEFLHSHSMLTNDRIRTEINELLVNQVRWTSHSENRLINWHSSYTILPECLPSFGEPVLPLLKTNVHDHSLGRVILSIINITRNEQSVFSLVSSNYTKF